MYKNLALINGAILAIMIFLNGMLASIVGPYVSGLIFHTLGLLLIIIIAIVKRNGILCFTEISLIFLLPGILSVITILLNNLSIPKIGLTLVVGTTLFGQLMMSGLVEHFGWFGMPVNRFRKEKILGFSIILLGVIIMIIL